jgi:predicted permease
MLRRLQSLIRAITGRHRFEDGMSEELRFHMEEYSADLVQSGVPSKEAMQRARIEFGSIDNVKEDCRQARGLFFFDELLRNMRYALRVLSSTPGFTAAAVTPFALCLGANLAIFAVIDSILLRPLPFPEAERLVSMYKTYPKAGVPRDGASPTNYYELRGRFAAFSAVSIYRHETAIVGEAGSSEREEITAVSPDFFSTLGVEPVMGHVFTDAQMTYETDRVVILTDTAWRKRFNSDPNIIGRQLRMDGVARTVVAVLPPGFRFLSSESRIYVPLASRPDSRGPSNRHSGNGGELIGRLRPGVTVTESQSQVDAYYNSVAHEYSQARMIADAGFRMVVDSMHGDHVKAIRPTLLFLQAGVLVLLLIGTVNLVNLLLIRASGRVKQMAIRLAMGAGKRHIVGEVLVETVLITLLGGLFGLVVGAAGINLLHVLGADKLPLGTLVVFDARIAIAALVGSLAIGIVVALPIAWYNVRGIGSALQSETRGGTASRAAQRLRHGFIVAQITLAIVLLSSAGLLGVSLEKVMSVSPGFQPDNLLSGQITLPYYTYDGAAPRLAFTSKLLAQSERLPGTIAVGLVDNLPLTGRDGKSAIAVKDFPLKPGERPRAKYAYSIDGDYFKAMKLPLIEGRFLTAADSRREQRVCVVDEDFARHYWPSGGAIGRMLFQGPRVGKDTEGFTIVGVVGGAKQADLTEQHANGAVYFPFGHRSQYNFFLVVRTSFQPESLTSSLRAIVRGIDSELPFYDVRSMESRIDATLLTRRAPAFLAAIFAGVALLLAAIGTYGVLSYAVSQRRREIGVRMALGARPEQIRSHFLSIAIRLLVVGTTIGVVAAWFTGRAMQAILFDVPALHFATLAAATALMAVVCIAACLLPSGRAARISPVDALSD